MPRSKVPQMLAAIETISARHEVTLATIAHAGDGNLHPLLLVPPGDDAARRRAHLAFEELLDAAIGFGGTVTAEHGVALLKKAGLLRELDPASLLQRAIKDALDPQNLFNPGRSSDLITESPRPQAICASETHHWNLPSP